MSHFLHSNTFKFFAILFALLIVFCGAILLATFSAEKVAFADSVNGIVEDNLISDPVFARNEWLRSGITVLNSFDPISFTSSGSWGTLSFDLPDPLSLVSSTLTFSIYAKVQNGVGALNLRYRLGTSSATGFPGTIIFNNTSYALYTYHINLSTYSFTNLTHLYCCIYSRDPGSIIDVLWAKCEVGSTFTGYVPFNYNNYGYDQGFEAGRGGVLDSYEQGYDAGYANGLLEVTGNTFVSDRTTWNNYESNPPFIQSGSYVVNNNHRWNVGFLDMFPTGLDYHNFAYSVNYKMGSYDGAVGHVLTFSNYAFDVIPNSTTPCIAITYSADQFTGTVVEFSLIMYEHYSDIAISIVDQSSHTNTYFYPVGNLNLYAFTVYRSSNMDTVFNAGVEFGDNRLNENSVSYRTGYNRGLSTAKTATFSSLIDAVVLSPIGAVQKMLDFNVLGMNMKDFYMSIFGIAILLFIIRLFIGAAGGSN